MRILFFHRWVGVHSGGTETHIKELALRLAKRGHQVDILTREGGGLNSFPPEIKIWRVSKNWKESDYSYEDIRVYYHTFLFMLKSFVKLLYLRLFKGLKYDVISVHFVTEAWVMRLIRRICGWPYLFILEGYTDLEAKEAKYANLQIAISQYEVNQCFKRYRYKPLFIPIGIDLEQFNTTVKGVQVRKKYSRNDEKLILTVCRLEPRKNIFTLISAAKIVCQRNSQIKFLLVGEGISREKIKEQIKKAKLWNKIILTGQVKDEELVSYYRACDLFVLPTLEEGFGIVLLEAMACGLPVISTTVGAVPEVVGNCGILIPPHHPKILAEKILEIMHNKTLREELIAKGLERVKEYDWDALIVKYEKAYVSCLKGESLSNG